MLPKCVLIGKSQFFLLTKKVEGLFICLKQYSEQALYLAIGLHVQDFAGW